MTAKQLTSYVFLGGTAVVMFALLVALVGPLIAGQASDSWKCPTAPPPPPVGPSIRYISAAVVSFAVGNLLGLVRYRFPPASALSPGQLILYQVVITVFFLTVALLLLYETFGTWQVAVYPDSKWWPITSFVRCATEQATWQTVAGICGVSALVGHWLHRRLD